MQLSIKDHKFSPAEIHVKEGQPMLLEITNQDATPEEFEMRQLAIEKVMVGGGKAKVLLRALTKGSYRFIGEYHEDTAHGIIVAE